jgi:Zn-dependent protease with chaperone function
MFARSRSARHRLVGIALPMVLAVATVAMALPPPAIAAPADSATAMQAALPAGTDYVAQVRANFTPENRAYASIRSALGFISPLWDAAAALFLLFSGVSARIRDLAFARARRRYVRVLIYFTLFSAVLLVLQLPPLWYRGFYLEHRFQLSNQTFGEWFGEQFKDLGVGIFFFGVLGLVNLAYLALEKSPRRWWLWLTAGVLPLMVIGTLIAPVVIDPLYNKFTPLRDKDLERKIVALAERADIPGRRVFQVDRSRQTRKLNAYVSGFGASQRIVLWDTTLQQMSEDEILFVMGHEMGHYKLAHIWKGILLTWLLIGVLLFASWFLVIAAIRRFGPRWRVSEVHDVASLPLFVACISLLSMVAEPPSNAIGRMIEHEADVFALEVTRLNDAGARAFIKLGALNRANPEPPLLLELFQYTHPPLIERIRFSISYRPWEEGKPNRVYRGPS